MPVDLEQDGRDETATHVVAVRDDTVIGTARLVESDGVAVVGRMAVAESVRRAGVGAAMLAELEALAAKQGIAAVELHAQAHAEDFYQRAGYRPEGSRSARPASSTCGCVSPFRSSGPRSTGTPPP